MTAFSDDALRYVDLGAGPWGSFRLRVGGKDVTYFRGVPATINGYQLTEPYSFGPAEFGLPSLTQFEVDDWGTGALRWMGNGKAVQLIQVDADGVKVRTVWRGFITMPEVTPTGVLIHCDGEASGRLALRKKLPDLFVSPQHVGRRLFDAFKDVHLTLTPYLGGDEGAKTDGRGMSGSYLDHCDALLAATIDTDGSQKTIYHRETQGDYHLDNKDTTTVDFSVFVGAHGVEIDLQDDLTESPNTIFGQGVAPSGLVWVNAKAPGLVQGEAPPYPMTDDSAFSAGTTDADTDTGDGVTVMISKLVAMNYLDRRDKPGGYDSDVTEAIKDLQDDAGLTQSGNMNTATWAALYDAGETGLSLGAAFQAPLAQASNVRPWNRTSNGSILGRNPNFDPKVPQVDLDVDHGVSVWRSQGRRWSKGVLTRSQNHKNWAGTVTLSADVFAGDYHHTDGSPTLMSRLDIKAGMNVALRHFDGGTLAHVAIVNVASDLSVTLGVDCQARDAATVGEVIARRIESRVHPARQWLRQRRANANARTVEFSELGGRIFDTVTCPGNTWTVFPVIAGQAGSCARVRLQTSDDQAEFVLGITALKAGRAYWQSKAGNPFVGTGVSGVYVSNPGSGYTSTPSVSITGGGGTGATATATVGSTNTVTGIVLTDRGSGYTSAPTISITGGGGSGATAHASVTLDDPWTNDKVQPLIDDQRALLGVWGDASQPCGYYPKSHTKADGTISDAPITGLFLDDGGFDYHTFDHPVLYVAIYPDRDTKIKPQRILWETLEVNT